jgi:TonB family protein
VRAGFVVASDGSVQDVEIRESVCEELDALVAATIAKSPKWEPATVNGKAVAQYLNIPIEFVLRQPQAR